MYTTLIVSDQPNHKQVQILPANNLFGGKEQVSSKVSVSTPYQCGCIILVKQFSCYPLISRPVSSKVSVSTPYQCGCIILVKQFSCYPLISRPAEKLI